MFAEQVVSLLDGMLDCDGIVNLLAELKEHGAPSSVLDKYRAEAEV